jgi:putative tricarboxylic transport membrane protein
MLGVLLLILSAVLVLQTILARRSKAEAVAAENELPSVSSYHKHARALGLLLIGVGYIVLVETVGYIVGIAYLLAAVTLFAGGASRRTVFLFAVLGAVFFWVLFVQILGIHQPQGFWPNLWHQVAQAQSISPAHSATSATL